MSAAPSSIPSALVRRRHGAWASLFPSTFEEIAARLADGDSIPARCSEILRDDRHGFVGALTVAGEKLIAKCPRYKDDRPWIRFWTLFRESHAFRTLRVMVRMLDQGLPVPRPVLALEHRRGGRVDRSWLCYRYVAGHSCDESHSRAIVLTLREMHALGWRHGDPHFANFLATDAGVVMLDLFSARRRRGRSGDWYDLILLRNSRPQVAAAIESPAADLAYRLADGYDRWIHFGRRAKRRIRSWFGTR